jgi:ABC-type sugar transport system permease subunit
MSSVAEKLQRKTKRPSGTRQVRLRLVYLDFWSAVKLSFLIALAGSIVLIVAVALVWIILNQTGVFDQIDKLLQDVTGKNNYSVMDQFSLGQVLGFTVVIGILNVVIGTVLGAIVSVLYNLSVRITGGLLVGFTNN